MKVNGVEPLQNVRQPSTDSEPGLATSASIRLVQPLSPLFRNKNSVSPTHKGSAYDRSSYSMVDWPDLRSKTRIWDVLACSTNEYEETWTALSALASLAELLSCSSRSRRVKRTMAGQWLTVYNAFSPVRLGRPADLRAAESSTSGVNLVAFNVIFELRYSHKMRLKGETVKKIK
jgi:hypothetical protein